MRWALSLTVDQAVESDGNKALAYPELAQAECVREARGNGPTPVTFHPARELFLIKQASVIASGLGFVWLTTGPLIGWHLAQLVVGGTCA